ncbi:unnamed protein product [Bemisia tabaci]|uniref:Uncharacterized protein n=1 Tax=Bemisia tabaci TaxID=7038 RepID=A0A9P0A4T5_BEMTA|nr:unnamed protein product [Bemisia tabaci]
MALIQNDRGLALPFTISKCAKIKLENPPLYLPSPHKRKISLTARLSSPSGLFIVSSTMLLLCSVFFSTRVEAEGPSWQPGASRPRRKRGGKIFPTGCLGYSFINQRQSAYHAERLGSRGSREEGETPDLHPRSPPSAPTPEDVLFILNRNRTGRAEGRVCAFSGRAATIDSTGLIVINLLPLHILASTVHGQAEGTVARRKRFHFVGGEKAVGDFVKKRKRSAFHWRIDGRFIREPPRKYRKTTPLAIVAERALRVRIARSHPSPFGGLVYLASRPIGRRRDRACDWVFDADRGDRIRRYQVCSDFAPQPGIQLRSCQRATLAEKEVSSLKEQLSSHHPLNHHDKMAGSPTSQDDVNRSGAEELSAKDKEPAIAGAQKLGAASSCRAIKSRFMTAPIHTEIIKRGARCLGRSCGAAEKCSHPPGKSGASAVKSSSSGSCVVPVATSKRIISTGGAKPSKMYTCIHVEGQQPLQTFYETRGYAAIPAERAPCELIIEIDRQGDRQR